MSVCRWLLLLYVGAVFLAPHVLPAEAVYGVDFLARFSGPTQMVCALAWAALFVPRSNRAIRRVLATCLERAEAWPRATRDRALLAACLALFWGLRSRTFYGDGIATVYHLGQGEWFNWKEPLDRALTQLATQVGTRAHLWGPAEAMAGVSVFAGGIWITASLACARLLGRSASEKSIVLGLLLTPGIVQLFFGNLEHHSLLAAGVLVFLTLGLRYLRGRGSFAWPWR